MKIENGKIKEATESELFDEWRKGWDDLFSFKEYLLKMENLGVKIVEQRETV